MRLLSCIFLLWMLLAHAGSSIAQHQLDFVIPPCPHLGTPPDVGQIPEVSVFPNPASTMLTVEFVGPVGGGTVWVRIYNVLGAQVLEEEVRFPGSTAALDVSELPQGLYVLQVRTAAAVISKKIIIRHDH